MRSLVLNWVTAGWRFENTKIFAKHFEKQWELLQDVALRNLDEYFNLDIASGKWLDQVGTLYGLVRPYSLVGDEFILDVSRLDDPRDVLDGSTGEVLDSLYKTLIALKASSSGKLFTMKNIKDNIVGLLGEDEVKVEFIENIDYYTELPKPMYFQLKLFFKSSTVLRTFLSLLENNKHLIGKPMGVSYDIICDWWEE